MKKIFVVVLTLAMTGTGAFAQGWTFNGLASGGFGAFFFYGEHEDPVISGINNNAEGELFQTQLDVNFVNEEATAGLSLRLRSNANTADPHWTNWGTGLPDWFDWFDWAYGWFSFQDNMFTVYGGLVENDYFDAMDRMFAAGSGAGFGFLTIFRPPVEGLSFGLGAFNQGASLLWPLGTRYFTGEYPYPGQRENAPRPMFTFSVSYLMQDVFRITAGVRNANEVTTSGPGWGRPGDVTPRLGLDDYGLTPSQAYLSFSLLSVPYLHLGFTARFMNLEEFVDYGDMRFYLTSAYTGVAIAERTLGLHLGFSFGLSLADAIDEQHHLPNLTGAPIPEPAPHLWGWLAVDYEVFDWLVPRIDFHWVMGGWWQDLRRLHQFSPRDGVTFHEEHMFFFLQPSVQFRLGQNVVAEVGGIFHFDVMDDHVIRLEGAENRPSWGAGGYGHNFAAYVLMRVSF
ncbi:MAG: hypothetical protein FWC64_07465 [Treponema sp.]|nr:hypothetical protein [Treponema sp.]